MENYSRIYKRRFEDTLAFRNEMWKVLCRYAYQKFIPENSCLLDVGAGYCEFINNIRCARKIALDSNPDVHKFAGDGVEVLVADSTKMEAVSDESVDVVFMSNLLEHLEKEEISRTLQEAYRVLKKEGRLLILQPNFRYCSRDYWMFYDHVTALDDRSVCEVLEATNFKIARCLPRFVPFSTKSFFPKWIFLLKLYLKVPLFRFFFGQQAFIIAEKRAG